MHMVKETRFKSDRCGIETSLGVGYPEIVTAFKSDRCGIETASGTNDLTLEVGSNQTVAGLKRRCEWNL